MSDKNHGHGSIKMHGLGRVYFRFSERPDGQFDFTIADDKAFSVAVESKILPTIEDVVHEIGNIGHPDYRGSKNILAQAPREIA